jgi:hypothetical protein
MNLYYFNPDNEMSIAHGGAGYTPPANITRMTRELGYLPAYLAGEGDCILMEQPPDELFLAGRRALFGMENRVISVEEAKKSRFHALRPWGWSPRVHGLLAGIASDEKACEGWTPGEKELYSRTTALAVLERMRHHLTLPDAIFPRVEETLDGIVVRARRQSLVIKSPWSSSGRGLLMVGPGEIRREEREWLSGVLCRQGYVMVEERLDRAVDFALEFWIEGPEIVHYLGLSRFFTGKRGNYQGNYIGPQPRVEQEITRHVGEPLLREVQATVKRALRETLGGLYRGPLGVDMMLYRDATGNYRVHPCVEINLRYNMGILALALQERYLSPGSEGIFRLSYFSRAGEAYRDSRERAAANPPCPEAGRIRSGYLPLTPVHEDTRFVAWITCHEEK